VLPSARTGETREQQLHYLLFRSLDFIPGEGKSAREMTADGYLGCINPQEPLPIFAYVTNTSVKILLALVSRTANDMKVKEVWRLTSRMNGNKFFYYKQVLRNIYKAYVANVLNPFYVYNSPIHSTKFSNKLDELKSSWS
jgi:hypothetical protein